MSFNVIDKLNEILNFKGKTTEYEKKPHSYTSFNDWFENNLWKKTYNDVIRYPVSSNMIIIPVVQKDPDVTINLRKYQYDELNKIINERTGQSPSRFHSSAYLNALSLSVATKKEEYIFHYFNIENRYVSGIKDMNPYINILYDKYPNGTKEKQAEYLNEMLKKYENDEQSQANTHIEGKKKRLRIWLQNNLNMIDFILNFIEQKGVVNDVENYKKIWKYMFKPEERSLEEMLKNTGENVKKLSYVSNIVLLFRTCNVGKNAGTTTVEIIPIYSGLNLDLSLYNNILDDGRMTSRQAERKKCDLEEIYEEEEQPPRNYDSNFSNINFTNSNAKFFNRDTNAAMPAAAMPAAAMSAARPAAAMPVLDNFALYGGRRRHNSKRRKTSKPRQTSKHRRTSKPRQTSKRRQTSKPRHNSKRRYTHKK